MLTKRIMSGAWPVGGGGVYDQVRIDKWCIMPEVACRWIMPGQTFLFFAPLHTSLSENASIPNVWLSPNSLHQNRHFSSNLARKQPRPTSCNANPNGTVTFNTPKTRFSQWSCVTNYRFPKTLILCNEMHYAFCATYPFNRNEFASQINP